MSTAATEEEAQAKKMFTLKSSDGESFEVEEAVAVESQTIKHMIVDDDCADINEIPLPNVTGKILAKVIEYCKKHVEKAQATNGGGGGDEELKKWDAAFLKIDQATLLDLMRAANYLGIKSLSDLTCQNVVDRIINEKTPNFNIKNDFTPEEVEEIRRKNLLWPFE